MLNVIAKNATPLLSKMTKEKYLEHFYNMVILGHACGLTTPQEWILNYQRSMEYPETISQEINEFCSEAINDLCSMDLTKDAKELTEEDIDTWFDSVKDIKKIL